MRLTVIGCSGSYPGPDSPASCYLVEADEGGRTWRLLLDLGSGALGALQRYADPLGIDALFLTHLHPDHFFDISGYYVMRRYHPAGAPPRIPVWGPPGTARRVAQAYGLPQDPGMRDEFDFREYDGQPVKIGPLAVTATRVLHPVDAFGLRIEHDGHSLAYSGDSAPCPGLVELAEGVDLFLSEAAFREGDPNPDGLHLTGREAGETAVKANAARLVLTHIPPWHDRQLALGEARQAFAGPVDLAATGSTYQL